MREAPQLYVPEHPWSDEQQAVIDCKDHLLVVDAFAGCAKTTTAIGYAAARTHERILYLCLNTANAEEARVRFRGLPHVSAQTTHAIAFQAMRIPRERITRQWRPILFMDQLRLRSARDSKVAMSVLRTFFASADEQIHEGHAKAVQDELDLDPGAVMNGVANARLAWKRMLDPSDSLQMPDDAYLKMFALRRPKLPYDRIIFDEAQDANPVTLQILRGQPELGMLCIGDRHQAIYQFRGSVNAMEQLGVGATNMHLSRTWRFGPQIAALANTLLSELKGEATPIQGMGADRPWCGERVTTLSRTNAELFRLAAPRRGEGVHWVGGIENYRLEQLIDAYHLFNRDRASIQNELMRRKFAYWDEYVQYGEDAGDGEVRIVSKIVEEFGHDVPQLVQDMRTNEIKVSREADLTLTTAHKSKGLEWDFVRISDDFEVLEKAEDSLCNDSGADFPVADVNLLYVAMTRARSAVDLNPESAKWLEELPKHRQDREAARLRRQQLLQAISARQQGSRAA